MCGIAGIWDSSGNKTVDNTVEKMTDAINHRGPDGYGHWISEDRILALGHRRLSIIDLSSSAAQPMIYQDRFVITFNGEIYNYLEIKAVLETKGYCFSSVSDTEVILAAYAHWGIKCLEHFDGMFSFAIYDKVKNELFCARDRFGEKPFHYYYQNGLFIFASEIKAIRACGIEMEPDRYSMYLFLNMSLHEDPADKTRTFYKNIKRLKPAHYFKFKIGEEINQECYWKIDSTGNSKISFENACLRFKELFETSVSRRLRSDVSVGTSLSGGLDSSLVSVVLSSILKGGESQKSFSARFYDRQLDEGKYIDYVLQKTGIDNYQVFPNSDSLVSNFENIMYHQEEPFMSASIYAQWEVFKLARQHNVTVLLDGQGADEVLAGYTHFFDPFLRETFLKKGKSFARQEYQLLKENNELFDEINLNSKFYFESKFRKHFLKLRKIKGSILGVGKVPELHHDLYEEYKRAESPFGFPNNLNETLEFFTFNSGLDKLLRFADRNSMAHSVEVRLPFLSHELVEFVFSLPSEYKIHDGWSKALIRYGFQDMLPKEIAWRKNKLGFQPPQKTWEMDKNYKDFAINCQKIASDYGVIDKHSPVCWKGVVTGLFIKQL